MIDFYELKQVIDSNKSVLVYFSAENCSVCEVLKPKIEKSFRKDLPKIKQIFINSELSKDITTNYNIFSNPTILIFFEGKEFYRVGRNISIQELIQNVKRPYEMLFKENK